MAFAQGEEFHYFTRVVFVWMGFAALGLVEPDEHCRVFSDFGEQGEPIAGSVAAEGVVLQPHQIGIANFLRTGSKVAVPKESELFLERPRTIGHAVEPPATEL